ncbi:MAG: tail fiber domain-containing protein [Ferruginibacter sp.]
MKRFTCFVLLLCTISAQKVFSQNIAINTTGAMPDTSAMLEITSTDKGLLLPRMTTAQMNAIPLPATGLLVFNTSLNVFEVNIGTTLSPNWVPLSISTSGWSTTGNAGTNSGTNFIGTTDNNGLSIKTNNTNRVTISNTGLVGIGTTNPNYKLHIHDATVSPSSGNWIQISNNASGTGSYDGFYAGVSAAGAPQIWAAGNLDIITGSGTSNNNSMRITSAGNIGIGTTSPSAQLHTTGTVRFAGLSAAGSNTTVLTMDASGNVATTAASSLLSGSTSVSNTAGTNTISTTVNGVTGTAVTVPNIYTTNGTLSSARTVTTGTNALRFLNGSVGTTINNSATDAALSLASSSRSYIRTASGSGGTYSYVDFIQDAANAAQLAVGGAATSLVVGSASGSTAPVNIMANGTTALTVINGGNVGIGIQVPTAQLHTTGTVRLANYPSQILATDASGNITTATAASTPNIYTADGTLAGTRVVTQGANTLAFTSTATNGFSVDGTTFSVDAANNRIGVNTAAPASYLSVKNGGGSGASSIADISNNTAGNTTDALTVGINNCGSTCAQNTARNLVLYNMNNTNTSFASLDFVPSTTSTGITGASIQGIDRDYTNGYAGFSFFTRNATDFGSRMVIKSSGNIGIGTTAPSAQLHTTGTVRLANYPSQILATDANGNITTATAASTPNIYTADGTLTGNRIVTQGANTLAFTSTATNGFSVDGTTFSVDAANNRIGIGTLAPWGRLDVVADNLGSGADKNMYLTGYGTSKNPGFLFGSANGTAASPTNLTNGDQIGGIYFTPRYNGAWPANPGSAVFSFYKGNGTTGLSDLRFNTSNTFRAIIDENGYMGIGTSTPGYLLNVVDATSAQSRVANFGATAAGATRNDISVTVGGLGNGLFMGYQNSSVAAANSVTNVAGVELSYLQANSGTGAPFSILTGNSRRLTITNSGNTGIGVTAPQSPLHIAGTNTNNTGGILITAGGASISSGVLWNGSSTVGGTEMNSEYFSSQRNSTNYHAAHPVGTAAGTVFINFSYAGTTIGSITQNSTTGVVYNTTSDIRLKENIRQTHFGLADLMKIEVKDYNYKNEKEKTAQTGFLAQQLYKIYPTAVTVGGEDANIKPWQVDYSKLTPLLVKAVQDQQAEIDTLKAENASITNQLSELKNTVAKILADIKSGKP